MEERLTASWMIPLMAEIKASSKREAEVKLDAFREATLPSENFGITLYRYQRSESARMALMDLKEKIEALQDIGIWDEECLAIIQEGLK